MSLLPLVFSSWWEDLERPHRLFDQHFGLTLRPDDLPEVAPGGPSILVLKPQRKCCSRFHPYDRTGYHKGAGSSVVQADKDKFQVTLDVQQFAPEEVSVKVVGKNIVVEGKHEEKEDEHGWISRQFVRKYMVPEQCDIDEVKSMLSSDGVLSITAPRKPQTPQEKNERVIRIQNTGQPALKDDTTPKNIESQKEQGSQTQKSPIQQRAQEKTVKAA
ncbi:protein lethal(2)essential for life [Orussus abietinus]|uniref:protein lethal(2)essential for life n=1 Tax=Orussus abietinus TaxID=222816 RepID=UPI000625663F|nr:protein lethal(2)essential for life [Orussus abietinus]